MRVVVVGGGVVGLACAFALVEDGQDVVVLEQGAIGGGASSGNAGWVTPSLATPLAAPGILRQGLRHALDPTGALVIRPRLDAAWLGWLVRFARASRRRRFAHGVEALHRLSRTTIAELDRMAAAGVEFEEHRAGLLAVARSPTALAWFESVFTELRRVGFEGRLDAMSADEAREAEPVLSPAVAGALYASVDRHVAPVSLLEGLGTHLARRGVELRTDSRATRLARMPDGWHVETAGGGEERADAVVVAAALGSVELVQPFGLRLPLVAAKGYSVTVPHADPTPTRPLYLCDAKLGLTPLRAGLRIAGFFELGARDAAPSAERCRQLVAETRAYLTAVEGSLEPDEVGWAGMRPATPDSLPLLGRVPAAPGLVLATGHGMLGVTLAPATGAAVASLLRGEDDAWLAPFAPARFA